MARRVPGRGSGFGQHEGRPALDAFTDALWRAWVRAGRPSYKGFEQRSIEVSGPSDRLAASTTQEILTGQRSGPASWDWVRGFWRVLRAVAADHGINPDDLGALEGLKEKHEAACAEHYRLRRQGGAASIGTVRATTPDATAGRKPEPGGIHDQTAAAAEAEPLAEIRQMIGVRHSGALNVFTEALRSAWVKAGPPTYSDFETRSKEIFGPHRKLPASTTQEILTGQRSRPVSGDWVRRFWSVLRAVAADHGIDRDSLGALEELTEKHEAALAEHLRSRRPGGAPGTTLDRVATLGVTPGHKPGPGGIHEQTAADVESGALAEIRQKIGVEWWSDYKDVVPNLAGTYLSLEPVAKLIHTYETEAVPGLLQTAAYADVVLRQALDTRPEAVIARLVELRMRRQDILRQPDPPRLWAVFHEAALLRSLGDMTIMRTQISHLMEISTLPNVTIQLIPSVTRIRALLGYPITLLRFRVPEMTDVVYFERLTSVLYLDTPDLASRYAQVLTGLSGEALHPAETVAYLERMLQDSL